MISPTTNCNFPLQKTKLSRLYDTKTFQRHERKQSALSSTFRLHELHQKNMTALVDTQVDALSKMGSIFYKAMLSQFSINVPTECIRREMIIFMSLLTTRARHFWVDWSSPEIGLSLKPKQSLSKSMVHRVWLDPDKNSVPYMAHSSKFI